MIYVIDDDEIMQECVARACGIETEVKKFGDAYAAMMELNKELPDLIFLDIMLNGVDGFTFLNELVSYTDTAAIPIVVVSSLDFKDKDLSGYGVVGMLDKAKMTPKEIKAYVEKYTNS